MKIMSSQVVKNYLTRKLQHNYRFLCGVCVSVYLKEDTKGDDQNITTKYKPIYLIKLNEKHFPHSKHGCK